MTQLSYQPAFDPFHTVFRFLRLRQAVISDLAIPRDHFRILDFYLLFPFRIKDFRVFSTHRRYKKLGIEYEKAKPYGDLPEDRVIFSRMKNIQQVALDTLVAKGLVDSTAMQVGMVKATEAALPDNIRVSIDAANELEVLLIEFLRVLAREYVLLGDKGLKERSGLMEHRYDAA